MADTDRPIRIVLAEDHTTVRQALRLLLDGQNDMQVVAEASDGSMAVQRTGELQPDVVVMDLSMPRMNGLMAARALKEQHPAIAIVVLTRYSDDAYLQELLRAGASGYVLKQSPSAELLNAIRASAAGKQYLDSAVTSQVTGKLGMADAKSRRAHGVTDREAEVLRLIALGHSNKEIASRLDLSVKTIEVHKANAMRKLDFRGRIDIVRFAILQGWLQDS